MAGVGGWVEKLFEWPDCRPMISALARRYAPCCGCRRLCAYADNDAQAARALNDASSAGFGITCNFDVDAPRSGPGWVPRARLACGRQGWVGGGTLTHPRRVRDVARTSSASAAFRIPLHRRMSCKHVVVAAQCHAALVVRRAQLCCQKKFPCTHHGCSQGERAARLPRVRCSRTKHASSCAAVPVAGSPDGNTSQRGRARPGESKRPAEAPVGTHLVAQGGAYARCVSRDALRVAPAQAESPANVTSRTLPGGQETGGEGAARSSCVTASWWRVQVCLWALQFRVEQRTAVLWVEVV